jgi:hypothetical protein
MSSSFPALGFDPAPGDPEEVARAARHVGRVAGEFERLAGELARLSDVSAAWRGGAALAFAESAAVLPRQLAGAAAAFAATSTALSAWSAEVTALQADARAVERRAAAAQQRVQAAREAAAAAADPLGLWRGDAPVALHGPAVTEALEDLRAARVEGERVREQARASARVAAAAVRAAAREAPPAPVLERLARWADAPFGIPLGQTVRDHEDLFLLVADAATVGSAVATVIPPFGVPVAAALGGVALLSHATVAAYADGSVQDIALDAAGLATLGATRVAHAGALAARAAERGVPVTEKLPPLWALRGPVGEGELRWRLTKLEFDGGGAAISAAGVQDVARRRTGPPPAPPPAVRGTPAQRRAQAAERAAARRALHELLVVPLSTPR